MRTFFAGERMTAMPRPAASARSRSSTSSQRFEPGRRYTEIEVNAELRAVWPDDVAALRRYLVDAQLLDRAAGEYWRIGGPFDCG